MIRALQDSTRTWRALGFLLAGLAMLVASTSALAQTMASSVSQHGITWFFDGEYQVGRYANGDWWVLGPVTITKITPESTTSGGRVINGTMVNPPHGHDRNEQGYDSGIPSYMPYVDALNRAPSRSGQPLVLSTGSTVSTISRPDTADVPYLSDAAILTVVSAVPPAGAFRPHPYGTDKTSYWTESQLNYNVLRSLSPVPSTPDLTARATQMLRFWNEQTAGWWIQRALQAYNNQEEYGSRIANRTAENVLMLHLNYSNEQKRDLFVGLVQYGLDIYGVRLTGEDWESDGGHNHGRKLPMLLAGLALDDEDILDYADGTVYRYSFQEDDTTFYVSQEDVDRVSCRPDNPCGGNGSSLYISEDIGLAEWGRSHLNWACNFDCRNWNISYRYVGSQYVATALATKLLVGGMAAWNWPAFFAYADRYRATGDASGGWGTTGFASDMWDAYRVVAEEASPPSPPILYLGE